MEKRNSTLRKNFHAHTFIETDGRIVAGNIEMARTYARGLTFQHTCYIVEDMARPLKLEFSGAQYHVTS